MSHYQAKGDESLKNRPTRGEDAALGKASVAQEGLFNEAFCFLSRVPWDVHYNGVNCACFFDMNGQCIDNPSLEGAEEYEDAFSSAGAGDVLENMLLVYVARHPGTMKDVVVGWYRNATLYLEEQYDPQNGNLFRAICDIRNAFLLLPNRRDFVVSMGQKVFSLVDSVETRSLTSYIAQVSPDMFDDIVISLEDGVFVEQATPEDMTELIHLYEEDKNAKLLPRIYGYAKEWSLRQPNNPLPWDRMGYVYLELVKLDQALEYFERALSLDPEYTFSLRDKVICLLRMGRYDEAIFFGNSLLDVEPLDNNRLLLSDAYHGAGFAGISYRLLKEITDPKIVEGITSIIAERERVLPFLRDEHTDIDIPDAYPVTVPFHEEKVPEIHVDFSGTSRYLDPIRLKGVQVAPEETVRQQVISHLLDTLGYPKDSLRVEESLSHIDKELRGRVDILVSQRDAGQIHNLMVIECKAPDIPLEGAPIRQLLHYNSFLHAQYVLVTNGVFSLVYEFDSKKNMYNPVSKIPSYDDVISKFRIKPIVWRNTTWMRPQLDDLSDPEVLDQYVLDGILGERTSEHLRFFILNLYLCLLDESHKLPCPLSMPGCTVVKDHGVIRLTTGNASGGTFDGEHRWFAVEDRNKVRHNVYLMVAANLRGSSLLYAAIEEKGKPVARLQLNLDTGLKPDQHGYRLAHSGVRSRKRTEPLIAFMNDVTPNLLGIDERVVLGWLPADKELVLSDLNTAETIANVLAYVILRSELRQIEREEKATRKQR